MLNKAYEWTDKQKNPPSIVYWNKIEKAEKIEERPESGESRSKGLVTYNLKNTACLKWTNQTFMWKSNGIKVV